MQSNVTILRCASMRVARGSAVAVILRHCSQEIHPCLYLFEVGFVHC